MGKDIETAMVKFHVEAKTLMSYTQRNRLKCQRFQISHQV